MAQLDVPPPPVNVVTDLHSIDEDGHIRAYVDDASGPVEEGSLVFVWDESEAGLLGLAVVREIDEETGRIKLYVDWDSVENILEPDSPRTATVAPVYSVHWNWSVHPASTASAARLYQVQKSRQGDSRTPMPA